MKFLNRFSRKKTPKPESTSSNDKPMSELKFHDIKDLLRNPAQADGEAELQRMAAYIERPTQKLLRHLLETKPAEITPTYDLTSGFRYADVEALLIEKTKDHKSPETFLDHLYQLDILEKQFFDTVSVCPYCQSPIITLHNHCPKCTSRHITKTSLTEHIPCGNIDEREHYLHNTCPKCERPLVPGQYRDMGRWYVCRACHERFETPQLDLICRKCGNEFTMQDALIQPISQYALNPKRESEIQQNVTSLESIYALLLDLGFEVEMPGLIIGEKSGIQHYFSLIATNADNKNIVIEHRVNEPEVTASQLILYLYKLSEIQADLPIFVAIPQLSTTAKQIAEGYQIMVIEGIPTDRDQLTMLKQLINERFTPETYSVPAEKLLDLSNEEVQPSMNIESVPLVNTEPSINLPVIKQDEAVASSSSGSDTISPSDEIKERFYRVLQEKSLQTSDVHHEWVFRRGKFLEFWRNDEGKFVKKPES